MSVTKVSVAAPDFRVLIRRAQKGDALARSALIEKNIGLVVYMAKRFYKPGAFMEMEDLMQQGCLGLIKAIEKFDAHRRFRGKAICFSTYACYWIRHMICREIANRGRTVALPVHRQALHQEKIPLELSSEDEDSFVQMVPLTAPDQENPETAFAEGDKRACIVQSLRRLSKRESFVIKKFYGLQRNENPRTLKDIGRRMGISKERARQIRLRALVHLRDLLTIPS